MFVALAGHEDGQLSLGGLERGRIPNGSELFSDAFSDVVVRAVMYGILGQMKLATLPGCSPQHSAPCRFQPGMVIRDDEGRAAHTAGLQALQERPPMHLSFGEGH